MRRRVLRLASGLLLAAGAVGLFLGLPAHRPPGWDATDHAFQALRFAEALRTLDFGGFIAEFHRAEYYAPLGRALLALGFLVGGDGWNAPRGMNCVIWIATIALAGLLARRLARPEGRDAAMLWTVFFGLGGALGVQYARSAFLEPASTLIGVTSVLAYLRARDRGSAPACLAAGLALGAALLVKYTYGLLALGAIGLSWLVDAARREGHPWRVAGYGSAALGLVLAWWFVLPLPEGLAMGEAHRERFFVYLTKAAILSDPGPGIVPIAWGLMSCVSLLAFALQLAGVGWGFARFRSAPHRVCAVLALAGPLAIAAYAFRIDRFVLPTLFPAWALGGALVASALTRLPRRSRPLAGLALVVAILALRGVGAAGFVRALSATGTLVGEWGPERAAAVREIAHVWAWPFDPENAAPAAGPMGTEEVLEVAARHLDPLRPFGWIGGTGTELHRKLVAWSLFRASKDRRTLYLREDVQDYFWEDPGWDEPEFRAWASGFSQVGVLDPPDPRNRPREHEVRYAAWMAAHPGFRVRAESRVDIEQRAHRVVIYERVGGVPGEE